MLIGDGTYTKEVAQQVASGIKYLLEHPDDGRYFELPTVKPTRRSGESGSERIEKTFSIRPDISRPDVITPLADGGEIIHCVTSEGTRLDILFGLIPERELQPAVVVIEA